MHTYAQTHTHTQKHTHTHTHTHAHTTVQAPSLVLQAHINASALFNHLQILFKVAGHQVMNIN